MSRIAPREFEAVEATPRRPVTPARKLRCHTYWNGICPACGLPVALDGPSVRYDHRITLFDGGADDDGPNLRPLHRDPCDIAKCEADAGNTSHTKRLLARQDGTRRERKGIASRPEPWTKGRKMQSRGFRS